MTLLLSRNFSETESYNLGQFFSALLRPISSAVKEMLIPVGRLKICGECAKAVFGGGGHLERGRSKYCAYGTGVGKGGGRNSLLI